VASDVSNLLIIFASELFGTYRYFSHVPPKAHGTHTRPLGCPR
jgi:hypothetical protein